MGDPERRASREIGRTLVCPGCGGHPKIRYIGFGHLDRNSPSPCFGYTISCRRRFGRHRHDEFSTTGYGQTAGEALSNASINWTYHYNDRLFNGSHFQ